METVYSEDSRQRIQNRIASATKIKLNSFGVENADELSLKFTQMLANGNSKEEVLSELEKYSKEEEGKTLEQVERHNKSFVDWLFGYSTVVVPTKKPTITHETPLTEPDTEITNEEKLNNTSTPAIDDISEDEGEKKKVNSIPADIAESILSKEQQERDNDENIEVSDDEVSDDDSLDESDDVPELNSDEEKDEVVESVPEIKIEAEKEEEKEEKEEKVEEKKPEVIKRRSFIRIKEGKSGRFTPIKSEDRHAFVKRNLARVATQLDVAANVQKKMMSHAVAVANASENLTLSKKKSTPSISNNLEKKKSTFRLDSTSSNGSSASSVYSSTNATFIQSFANKTFPKTSKSSTPTSTGVTPDKSKVVRCSYWPNCNRGDECKFWHPKELCPNLNNCPDGDQCLYIHPAVPQNQLNKIKKKKSESTLEVNEAFTTPKHTLQKKLSKRESLLSLNSNLTPNLLKKTSKVNLKEANVATNSHVIECKFGANCTRPDCKFSHPSPAAILAAAALKKKESKIKEKLSMDFLKHKESRSKLLDNEEDAQNILCRFDPDCKRANCKFMHTNK